MPNWLEINKVNETILYFCIKQEYKEFNDYKTKYACAGNNLHIFVKNNNKYLSGQNKFN